jgi:hypothetical protein
MTQHLQPALHMPEPLSITYKYDKLRVTEANVILLTNAAMSSSIAIQMYQKLNSSWGVEMNHLTLQIRLLLLG